jgi:hypothetical protein
MGRAFNPEARGGGLGWAALAGGVILWDKLASETLTNSCRRGLDKHPELVIGAVAVIAAHLTSVMPERLDPISLGAKHLLHIED